jgi:hypothetical protein
MAGSRGGQPCRVITRVRHPVEGLVEAAGPTGLAGGLTVTQHRHVIHLPSAFSGGSACLGAAPLLELESIVTLPGPEATHRWQGRTLDQEDELYRHYGVPYSRADSPSGLPAGEPQHAEPALAAGQPQPAEEPLPTKHTRGGTGKVGGDG